MQNSGNQNSILGADIRLFCILDDLLKSSFCLNLSIWKMRSFAPTLCESILSVDSRHREKEPKAYVNPKGVEFMACSVTSLLACDLTNTPTPGYV